MPIYKGLKYRNSVHYNYKGEDIKATGIECDGSSLRGIEIQKLILKKSKSDCMYANSVILRAFNIAASTLSGCQIENAFLYYLGYLINVRITNSIFNKVYIENTVLTNTTFKSVAFINCYFYNCKFQQGTVFEECSFSGCAFEKCTSTGLSFKGCDFNPKSVLGPFDKLKNNYPNVSTFLVRKNITVECSFSYLNCNNTPETRTKLPPMFLVFSVNKTEITDEKKEPDNYAPVRFVSEGL